MLFALAGNLLWNKPCCRRRCKSTQHGKIQNQKLTLFMQLSHWDLHQNTPIKAKGSPKGELLQGDALHIMHALCICIGIIGIVMSI